jgi:hypothetical protein
MADFASVARFKLASRKTEYRPDELISFELAIMNVAKEPIYFHKLSDPLPTLLITSQDGTTRRLPLAWGLEGLAPESYELVNPKGVLLETFYMVGDCNNDRRSAFDQKREKLL